MTECSACRYGQTTDQDHHGTFRKCVAPARQWHDSRRERTQGICGPDARLFAARSDGGCDKCKHGQTNHAGLRLCEHPLRRFHSAEDEALRGACGLGAANFESFIASVREWTASSVGLTIKELVTAELAAPQIPENVRDAVEGLTEL